MAWPLRKKAEKILSDLQHRWQKGYNRRSTDGFVNVISEALKTHRIVCGFVKFSNGSIPQAKGSSRLYDVVRGRVLTNMHETDVDKWFETIRRLQRVGKHRTVANTCHESLTVISACTPERV